MFTALRSWPKVSRIPADLDKIVPKPYLGLDLEWDIRTEKPTILGVSDGVRTVSVPFEEGKTGLRSLLRRYPKASITGHNVLQSDIPVLENMGIQVDPSHVEDTIIRYWLTHAHLSKMTQKDADGESVRRGAGFMNLWTMLSLMTDLPCYKYCRENVCEGPCPKHDVYGYNGLDALGPVLAMPRLLTMSKLLGVDSLYNFHRKLALVLYEMRQTGVFIDRGYVAKLRSNWEAGKNILYDKQAKSGILPFNPDSPKQVHEYFSSNKVMIDGKKRVIKLKDTREDTIKAAIERMGLDQLDGEDLSNMEEPIRMLFTLRDWKAQGDGPDRWFADRYWDEDEGDWEGYVDGEGLIHANLGFYTSTARMMCSSPNLQNVPARRRDPVTGEKMKVLIRRAFKAPPGYYIMKADYSNAENRTFLHLAGYKIPVGIDLHTWVAKIAGLKEGDPLAMALGGPRDAAKSVQHAGNYMEGLDLVHPSEIRTFRIQSEIRAGARLIYPKWTFQERVVSFTGINLARRMFGTATIENRRKALQISQAYFGRFPKVRELQMRISQQAEKENMVRPPNGYVLRSYGPPEDRMKTAAATWGSQPVAHYTKVAILNAWSVREKIRPVLQVHDEILYYVPNRIPKTYAKKLVIEAQEISVPEIPGLKIPVDVGAGATWGDAKEF